MAVPHAGRCPDALYSVNSSEDSQVPIWMADVIFIYQCLLLSKIRLDFDINYLEFYKLLL